MPEHYGFAGYGRKRKYGPGPSGEYKDPTMEAIRQATYEKDVMEPMAKTSGNYDFASRQARADAMKQNALANAAMTGGATYAGMSAAAPAATTAAAPAATTAVGAKTGAAGAGMSGAAASAGIMAGAMVLQGVQQAEQARRQAAIDDIMRMRRESVETMRDQQDRNDRALAAIDNVYARYTGMAG